VLQSLGIEQGVSQLMFVKTMFERIMFEKIMFLKSVLVAVIMSLVAGSIYAEPLLGKPSQVYMAGINEISGIVKSRRFDDVYWVHNDSGDEARLFALDSSGEIVFPGFLTNDFHGSFVESGKEPWPGHRVGVAANIDWEDIAIDDEMIYVADMGNNGNARRDLGVYVIPEPNPRAVESTRPIRYLPIKYPEQEHYPADQWHFDSESLFVDNGTLYFISKHRQPGQILKFEPGANLYRLDTQYTDRQNALVKIDHHDRLAVATGADLSPDGRWLAVISYVDLWLFERPARGDQWFTGKAFRKSLDPTQIKTMEAIAWEDNDNLVVANEEGEIYRVSRDTIAPYIAD
jgi:hypothetical protein